LPLRLAEYGDTFRYEKHGSLSGLLRVRAMCMNDAHIYCEYEQVREEFARVMEMYRMYYEHLRIGNFRVCLSLHDEKSEKFIGAEEEWLRSEAIVREVLHGNGIEFDEEKGEAAFYGPKVDIQLTNLLGREETVSTCQLDFVMASRFDLKYTARDGSIQKPYIIHRAPLSTHERMISFLIEFYGGAFPSWMAPVQVRILPITDEVAGYTDEIARILRENLLRAEVDDSSASFNKKVRNAVTAKIPNIWIIGREEAQNRSVTWRRYCTEEQPKMPLDKAIEVLKTVRDKRMMDNFQDVELPRL
jgi:threonyl-tRNA synthetase